MKLPLSIPTIEAELTGARALLDQIIESLHDEAIPGVTAPGGPDGEVHLAEWLTQFSGELMLVARKCENVAVTLNEPPGT